MGANIAGIYGAQIFREDDKPLYRRGFGIAIGVLCLGLALSVFRWAYGLSVRRKTGMEVGELRAEELSDGPSDEHSIEKSAVVNVRG